MKRTYKYRIYANKDTLDKAIYWIDMCRYLYNCSLEQRIMAYKSNKRYITYKDQQNELPELKKYIKEFKVIGSQTLQDVLRRVDKGYKSFFKKKKQGDKAGLPRFKNKNRYKSFTLTQSNWNIEGKYLNIRKIGRFKLRLSREIKGNIKAIIITHTNTDKWYASFQCIDVPNNKVVMNGDIGIDMGITNFITDSTGKKIDNPRYFKSSENEMRIAQRTLSRRKLHSKRRVKAKMQVAKLYEKITNQRNDFTHKISTYYASTFKNIYIEDLMIENMGRDSGFSTQIYDSSWGKFFRFLSYKAEEAGGIVIKVNPRNTSKTCSKCLSINHELKLSHRVWICENCGKTHDRDENAAINIQRLGQSHQPLTCAVSQSVG